MNFKELSLSQFIEKLSSNEPTPGGGTASAVSIAMGAALLKMYALVSSSSKKVTEENRELCEKTAGEMTPLIEEALNLADRDTDAFNHVMDAFRLPKDTEEQKQHRREKIAEATIEAARVPFQTATCAIKVLEGCLNLNQRGTPFAQSDLETAFQLARAGLAGALENVAINLESLDEEKRPHDIVQTYEQYRQYLNKLPLRLSGN